MQTECVITAHDTHALVCVEVMPSVICCCWTGLQHHLTHYTLQHTAIHYVSLQEIVMVYTTCDMTTVWCSQSSKNRWF